MKIREWMKKRTGRKGYAAAGILCLAAAILALSFGPGLWTQAEALPMGSDGEMMDFTVEADGSFAVDSEMQLKALGSATAAQTEGKTFVLTEDIEMKEIDSAAVGTFAGILDGQGHVIAIQEISIHDSTTDPSEGVSQGVLFGTVSGTIQNLIVDVQDEEASYTRTSDAGVEQDGTPTVRTTDAAPRYQLNLNETVSELDGEGTDTAKYDAYLDLQYGKNYTEVYLDENMTEVEEGTPGAVKYKKYESNAEVSTETAYQAAGSSVEDSFGILCGTLAENGRILQVSLNGSEVRVEQTGKEHSASVAQVDRTPHYYYYEIGQMDKVEAADVETDPVSLGVMKDDPGESSEEAANATVSQILRLSAAVPGGVLADERGNYSIRYRLTVSPEAGGTLENVTIAINGLEAESVSWSGGGTTGSGESFSLGEVIADTEVICTVTGNLGSSGDEIEKNLGFTAKADVGEQTVAAKVENVGTTIRSGAAIDADIKVENPDVREGVLNLSVSAEEGKPNDGKATITYTVTVQNNSTRILEGVTVAYPSDATYSGDLSEETVGDDNTVTRSDTLNGDRNWTVKFTREVREGDDTSASFRAWATLSTGGAQQTVSTGSVTSTANITGPSQESGTEALRKGASTGNVRNAAAASKAPGDSGALAGGTLILTVQNPKNAIRGEQIEYDLTLTAPAGQQVTLTSDQELYWDGMGTSYTYTVIGTGEAQEIQAAITAPADGDEFTCRFSAKTDGGYATSVAETKTGLLDGREISDSGSNESIAGRGLLLEVSAAQEAAGTSGDAQIVYTVQTTVPNLTGTLTLQALDENGSPVSGTWTNETSTTEGDAYETPGTSRTSIVKFTRTVSDPEGLTEKIGTSFRAVYTQTNGNVLTARTEKLETTVYRSSVSLQDADDALEVSLTRTGTNSFTLTLTNSGTGPVAIKKDCLTGWDLATENGWLEESYEVNSGTSYKGGIFSEDAGYYILAGTASESAQKTVTLTRSVAEPAEDPVTVTITGVRLTVTKIATYTYRKETTGRPTGAPVESGTVRSAIDLAAGALAGKTEAGSSIEACRQEIHLTGATTTDNDAKLTLGGISGRSDGSDYKDLYVKGSVSGGSDGAKGLVSGAAADTALTYAVVAEAAELEDLGAGLTLEAGTLRLGSDGAPEESWDAWTSFELYDKADADKSETAFDLGWLVKKREAGDEGLFDYNNPSATSASPKVTVSLHSGAAVTKQPLDFTVVYRARKMLADSIYTQYISGLEEKNTFDLEASGYYQLVSAYATDGYYHYVQSYGTTGDDGTVSYTTVYPYTTERPVFYDETEGATPWSVEREDTGLEDQIVLQLTPNGWTVNDLKVWYGEEGGKPAEISDSKARFEFQEEAVIITAVPELNEKIYEEFTSPEFTSKDREPLPGPTLTDENYYDAEGNTVTSEWSKTNSYESGGSLTMTERASGCDYTYQFSEESPMTEEGSIWTTAGDGVWRTTDTVGAGLSEGWESVGSDFKIPIPEVTEDSVKYLYILVSRENYPDTVYCYGPVNIVPAASGEPQFYYNYYQNDAGDWEGDPIEDNDPIVAGDTLVINVKASDNLKTAEYRLAENELPQSELADTERWTEYTEPVAIEKEGEWAACYLYV
ncbi:MAG: hypothetical protein Q4C82_04245, partial [Eubacteriales bacterium]|nr:hypothetical protein [Eubacteriales bacterium]